ncbi:MAG: glutamate--cysteine ligase [Leifsonia flava]
MRTVGVEEELLLVSAETGRPVSVAGDVLQRVHESGAAGHVGGALDHEFKQQQVETASAPHSSMSDLGADVKSWRATAIAAARQAGALVIASGTSPMPAESVLMPDARYAQIAELLGQTARDQLACACHVHVSVESDEEGVGVLDRIREWLHVLLALSANSPFWQGMDTGYASYRSEVIRRWPTSGVQEVFGTPERYHALVAAMKRTGVMLDDGMVYFEARLSHHYPTVEIRVADVCADADDTVLIAALCRALVDTAAAGWRAGTVVRPIPAPVIRLAAWHAGRFGLSGDLLDSATMTPMPARDVVARLIDHVRAALKENGDEEFVDEQVRRILDRGNGADRQRAVLTRTHQLVDVVSDLARATAGDVG